MKTLFALSLAGFLLGLAVPAALGLPLWGSVLAGLLGFALPASTWFWRRAYAEGAWE